MTALNIVSRHFLDKQDNVSYHDDVTIIGENRFQRATYGYALPYMALLRNLRNIVEAGVDPEHVRLVANRISNPVEVRRSKQLPFRFVSAYEQLPSGTPSILKQAVADAIDISLENVPQIGDGVWVILDCSGSMESGYGYNDADCRAPIKTGALFASALMKANKKAYNFNLTLFSDRADFCELNPNDSVLTMYKDIMKKVYGGGTNLEAALRMKSSLGFDPDVVIVISDMQVNRLRGPDSTKIFNPGTVKIALDLNAYDTTPIPEHYGWYQLSGWSEKLFDMIPAMRNQESVVEMLSKPYKAANDVESSDEVE